MTFEFRDAEDMRANQKELREWTESRKKALSGLYMTRLAQPRKALGGNSKKPRKRPGSR